MIKIKGKVYTKLNLGCGNTSYTKFPHPWLNVDIEPGVADYICDVRKLPIRWNNFFKEVRASHILEHLYLDEWILTLDVWTRVLEPGGTLRIIIPDLDIVIQSLIRGYDNKFRPAISGIKSTSVMAQIFGIGYESSKTDKRWRHRMILNAESLIEVLENRGEFTNIMIYNKKEDPAYKLGIKDDSQNQFSLCIRAEKQGRV